MNTRKRREKNRRNRRRKRTQRRVRIYDAIQALDKIFGEA